VLFNIVVAMLYDKLLFFVLWEDVSSHFGMFLLFRKQ